MTQFSGEKALLFDLDGTLLDSAPAFLCALDTYCDQAGLTRITEHREHYASAGARAAVAQLYNIEPDHPDFENHRADFLEIYLETPVTLNQWYPGIENLLKRLTKNRVPWGIVTNKPRPHTEAVLGHLMADLALPSLVCQGDLPTIKPDPAMLHAACNDLGLAPDQCIYAGDHLRDIQAAKAAGMPSIACTYGYLHDNDTPELWGADALVRTPQELTEKAFEWLTIEPIVN